MIYKGLGLKNTEIFIGFTNSKNAIPKNTFYLKK